MRRFGHDRISTFGIGADHDALTWRSIARQLAAAGLLEVDVDTYGALRLSPASGEVLRGERQVHLKRDRAAVAVSRTRSGSKSRGSSAEVITDLTGDEVALFDRCASCASSWPSSRTSPPTWCSHDRTLREIARARPASRSELSMLHGVGAAKLDRYGDAFLDCVRDGRATAD